MPVYVLTPMNSNDEAAGKLRELDLEELLTIVGGVEQAKDSFAKLADKALVWEHVSFADEYEHS